MGIRVTLPPIDPTEKMRYKLDQAYWIIEKYKKRVSRETAWMLRDLYYSIQEREHRKTNFGGGSIVKKNKRLGYASGMLAARYEFAIQMEKLFEIVGGHYPYENKAVSEMVKLAEACDLMAAWKCAEDLGNLCLLPGWLTPKQRNRGTSKKAKSAKRKK